MNHNYHSNLIAVAEDCRVASSVVPKRGAKPTVALDDILLVDDLGERSTSRHTSWRLEITSTACSRTHAHSCNWTAIPAMITSTPTT